MEKTKRASTSRESDKYIVRLPDGMRDRIAEAARANNRSMNAELVARLEASFSGDKSLKSAHVGELIEELMDRFPAGRCMVKIGDLSDEDKDD